VTVLHENKDKIPGFLFEVVPEKAIDTAASCTLQAASKKAESKKRQQGKKAARQRGESGSRRLGTKNSELKTGNLQALFVLPTLITANCLFLVT
jgi:Mg-chelatase subunit ChlD